MKLPPPTADRTDGLGDPIDPIAFYYVQDMRTVVGNCASWWAPSGMGYVCDLNLAGIFSGADVAGMRGTDVPWPVAHVSAGAVLHVRGDTQLLDRRNYKPGPR